MMDQVEEKLWRSIRKELWRIMIVLAAAGLVYGIFKADEAFRKYMVRRDVEINRNLEAQLQTMEYDVAHKNRLESILVHLENLPQNRLNVDQMRRRQMLIGDINLDFYQNKVKNPDRDTYFDIASKAYESAIEYTHQPGMDSAYAAIVRRIATIYVDNKKYLPALKLIRENDSPQILPNDRWTLRLLEAEALKQTGRPVEAIRCLDAVADETNIPALRAKSMREKGDILSHAASAGNEKTIRGLYTALRDVSDPKPEEAALDAQRDFLLRNALHEYQQVVNGLSSITDEVSHSQLGILKIHLLKDEKNAAFTVANTIQNTPTTSADKIEALVLLSERLYEAAVREKDWKRAFSILEGIVAKTPGHRTMTQIVSRLLPRNSGIIDTLALDEKREGYFERLQTLFARLRIANRDTWEEVELEVRFLEAYYLYLMQKYEESEKIVASLIPVPYQAREVGESIMALDMDLATRAERPPVVLMMRSIRYLDAYPGGKHYPEAMINILNAYCSLKLYDSALDMAKKIYVDMMRRDVQTTDPGWLRVVAKIAESYDKLGKFDMANRILKDNARTLLDMETDPDVFLIWANSALERGQIFEALRRLDVVIPRMTDVRSRAKLIVARYLLQLKVGSLKDYDTTRELLDTITASHKLPKDQQTKLERELYKGLLEYAFRVEADGLSELVSECTQDFSRESWPSYWALRELSREYGRASLPELAAKHEAALRNPAILESAGTEAQNFIRKQLETIQNLNRIDQAANPYRRW